jgi:NADH-quinone oxidoreductase subunit L
MELLLYIGLFAPLAGFLCLLTFANSLRRNLTGFIGCTSVFISFLCFASILYLYHQADMTPQNFTLFSWIPVKGIDAKFSLLIDPLSLLMTMVITGVGFLIHVYSNGYIDHDEDYARYFACMNFFIFSMLLLVLAADILLLFVGWEGVGVASYLLIGYYYERGAAAQAAVKAFVVNRIGDCGLLIGLLLTFYLFGTANIAEICSKAVQHYPVGSKIMTLLALLYFIGSIGKSAQLPLHTWLPDAMEGPTPVSALIHAATMVTAGVYLVVRLHLLYETAPDTLYLVGVVGAVTAFFAATCAISQTDLKRVLAYSTVSQLGFMFTACGAGAFYAAMFHLTTHAFIKGLLFLSAGNVVHMLHGLTDMRKMGGLFRSFPVTHWLFLIGLLALSGIPPTAAFLSKDLILEQEYRMGYTTLYWIAFAASILTGFYLTRAYCLTFLGEARSTAKEAPYIMLIPALLLTLLSVFGGLLGYSVGKEPPLEEFLEEVGVGLAVPEPEGFVITPQVELSVFGGIVGISLAAIIYILFVKRLGKTITLFNKAFFINELYRFLFVQPLAFLAKWIAQFWEPKVFEGSISGAAATAQRTAAALQVMQSGQIRSYAAWMALGMALLILYFTL